MVGRGKKKRTTQLSDGLATRKPAEKGRSLENSNSRSDEKQELRYLQLEEELHSRERELARLQLIAGRTAQEPAGDIGQTIARAIEAVEEQDQRLADHLERNPWLQQRLGSLETRTGGVETSSRDHLGEADWRLKLMEIVEERQQYWQQQLQESQQNCTRDWFQNEQIRLKEQYDQLELQLLERKHRLEEEWSVRLREEEYANFPDWLDKETQTLTAILRKEKEELLQSINERDQASRTQLSQKLQQAAEDIAHKEKQELRLLETEWREQEVLARERPKLQKLWADLVNEQRHKFESLLAEIRHQVQQEQLSQTDDWLSEQSKRWSATQAEWLNELKEQQRQQELQSQSERRETATRQSVELMDTVRATLESERAEAKQLMGDLTANWQADSGHALQAARQAWQSAQAEQTALLRNQWTNALDSDREQARVQRTEALRLWQAEVNVSWAEVQKKTEGEMNQSFERWLSEHSLSLDQTRQQFEQESEKRLQTTEMLLKNLVDQHLGQISEAKAAADGWFKEQSGSLAEAKRRLEQQVGEQMRSADLRIQSTEARLQKLVEQQLGQISEERIAADSWFKEQASSLAETKQSLGQQVKEQTQAAETVLQNLVERSLGQISEARIAGDNWFTEQSSSLAATKQTMERQVSAQLQAAETTLQNLVQQHMGQISEARTVADSWFTEQSSSLTATKQTMERQVSAQLQAAETTLQNLVQQHMGQISEARTVADSWFTEQSSSLTATKQNVERQVSAQLQAAETALRNLVEQHMGQISEAKTVADSWFTEQSSSLTATKRSLEQQLSEQLQQGKTLQGDLIQQSLAQISDQSGAFSNWLNQQSGLLAETRQHLQLESAEQAELAERRLMQLMDQQISRMQENKSAVDNWLTERSGNLEEVAESIERRCNAQLEQAKLLQGDLVSQCFSQMGEIRRAFADWLMQQSSTLTKTEQQFESRGREQMQLLEQRMAGLLDQRTSEVYAVQSSFDSWIKDQSDNLIEMEQQFERQRDELLHKIEEHLEQMLELSSAEFKTVTGELLANYQNDLADGRTALLEQTTKQLSATETQMQSQLSQILQEMAMHYSSLYRSGLTEHAGSALTAFQDELNQIRTAIEQRSEQALTALQAAGTLALQEKLQQTCQQIEQSQHQRWNGLVVQMLANQKQELVQTVEETDQRLLQQIQDNIGEQVKLELARQRQSEPSNPTEQPLTAPTRTKSSTHR